ncbi:MAG: hypothetical protein P4L85_05005 [Paludisphaera borealis]|uniref:hypothetical protein n=1 Tax=Paludisphaera borealis TaxID=1387353 RepID=UPI0028404A2D|nr:hypothetical protein [Paludisphaera borealis]MDR3618690.1 hypothetical protein [Paludisphaera borealis]
MTMTGRFVDNGIRILAAVVLLAVMFSPIRPTKASHATPSPNSLPRNFAVIKFEHSSQFTISARPSLRAADSLQSGFEDELDADIEDELTLTSPPASVSFNVLPSPCPEPRFELASFAVALTARPLRC